MAVFVGGNKAASLDSFSFNEISAGAVTVATATTYRITRGASYDQFTGNLIYTDGVLTGGTITGWTRVSAGGSEFTVTGLALPVITLLGALDATDDQAFLEAVFNAADTMTGTALNDVLGGFDGDDSMAGGAGNDSLFGLDHFDTLDGGAGNDQLLGGDGNDSLIGGTGDDILSGEAGLNTLAGGAGDDFYFIEAVGTVVQEMGGQGTDTVLSGVNHELADNVENLALTGNAISGTGNALANAISGNGKDNKLEGDAGNDTLDGDAGADSLTGGVGNDVFIVDEEGDDVVEIAGEGKDTVQSSAAAYTLASEIENLTLLEGADDGAGNGLANVIAGNAGWNKLYGFGGNDTISGGDGLDLLDGGSGDDSMAGGYDSDTYIVNSAGDKVSEAAVYGHDEVQSAIDYTLGANLEDLVLTGFATKGTGNALSNYITGGVLASTLNGGAGDDSLVSQGGNDSLIGGAGNDGFDANGGDDTMAGGTGDDHYRVDEAGDLVVEVAGQGQDICLQHDRLQLTDAVEESQFVRQGHGRHRQRAGQRHPRQRPRQQAGGPRRQRLDARLARRRHHGWRHGQRHLHGRGCRRRRPGAAERGKGYGAALEQCRLCPGGQCREPGAVVQRDHGQRQHPRPISSPAMTATTSSTAPAATTRSTAATAMMSCSAAPATTR